MKFFLSIIGVLFLLGACSSGDVLDLSGDWTVKLDRKDTGIASGWAGQIFETGIYLPGTLDKASIGDPDTLRPALNKEQLQHLRRRYSYTGPAWYSREFTVPVSWKGKSVILEMERVIWSTDVWVDGKKIPGRGESLVAPHRFDISQFVKPGKRQVLTVRVDNRKQYSISQKNLAHAYTDHTQIVWNGIEGEIKLSAYDKIRIEDLIITPSADLKSVELEVIILNEYTYPAECSLSCCAGMTGSSLKTARKEQVMVPPGRSEHRIVYDMGPDPVLWSEFNPAVYEMTVSLTGSESRSSITENFGMRTIRKNGNRLEINGRPLFLRGTLECCIFPLTGTPPMDESGWEKVFSAAKDYGLNHLRFHSWCPPEAAFDVADSMGFYLQVELPVWTLDIGEDSNTVKFIKNEAARIIKEYGNHPSFALMSMGNELEGNFDILAELVNYLKLSDGRHLYTTTSYTFQKGHGKWPEPQDEFFITQRTRKGWVRGQGVFNDEVPSFDKDYSSSVEGMEVPLVTHEIGQYAVYPDLSEIGGYTGVLYPLNLVSIKNDLEDKGLYEKSASYLDASGKLAALLYKEEIERALKTEGISGFQMLDLHDFPGQGTALVGLLNSFWESKGIISGEEFRQFCSPQVPLLRFPKAVYENDETFYAELDFANYGVADIINADIQWSLSVSGKEDVVASGTLSGHDIVCGYNPSVASIEVPLNGISDASMCRVSVSVSGTDIRNAWHIWVYPETCEYDWGEVRYTRSYAEAEKLLAEGKTVLFNPDWRKMKGIEGKFVPVFWSPVHFPKQAATMGILCDPGHGALSGFPTENHTDWQWWDLNINSTTMVVDSLHGGTPIVEMIDNFVNNRRLALLYEGKVGAGKLMLASFDLCSDLENRPVARQMLYSILDYMNSPAFSPARLSGFDKMQGVFDSVSNEKQSADSIYN